MNPTGYSAGATAAVLADRAAAAGSDSGHGRLATSSYQLPPGQVFVAGSQPGGLVMGSMKFDPQLGGSGGDYVIPDLRSRPRARIAIERVYLPVALAVNVAPANPVATQAELTLLLKVQGVPRWTSSQTLTLVGLTSPTNWSQVNTAIAADLTNPILLEENEVALLTYAIATDVAAVNLDLGVAEQFPAASGPPTPAPGVIAYSFET